MPSGPPHTGGKRSIFSVCEFQAFWIRLGLSRYCNCWVSKSPVEGGKVTVST